MSDDEKLIEAVASDPDVRSSLSFWGLEARKRVIAEVIAAINDSGTHWVARWDLDDPAPFVFGEDMNEAWAEVRDACLAEWRKP